MSRVVCTLGMHRSGTSVVSRMLSLAGVWLGTDASLADTGSDNPTGFWEHAGFKRINDALLHRFGGLWDRPPSLPDGWLDDHAVRQLMDEARAMVRAEFAGAEIWSWKDPRTCLTLPFWQAVVGPMHYIICLRDPRDAVASLQSRNGLDAATAEALWLTYVESALRHTSGQPRVFVDYDAVLADAAGEFRRVARFAGAPAADDEATVVAVQAYVAPALQHHRAAAGMTTTALPPLYCAGSLYLALRHASTGAVPLPDAQIAALAAGAQRAAAAHAATAAAYAAAASEAAALRNQTSALARDNAELRRHVERLDVRCGEYERENDAVRRAIADIHASSAWRLVIAWRRATAAAAAPGVTPPGLRRQRRGMARRTVRQHDAAAAPIAVTPVSVGFCTLAIHAPYRLRARRLIADAPDVPWVVATDVPSDFADLPVHVVLLQPSGPMAVDYLARLAPTGNNKGAAAYHDKRFAVHAALQRFETAIFLDADSRLHGTPALAALPPGLSVLPVVTHSIDRHLLTAGAWRRPAFEALATTLLGRPGALVDARWCHETCYAVTRDGREARFFDTWARAAALLQEQGIHSGEGGVMGLAALAAGWRVDYTALSELAACVQHEGGGPKGE